jgi:NADPH-dependent 2,4-dienoyl-CoA reductase/sulfur reductase-like enzyme
MMPGVVIIGAGLAGLSVAEGLRAEGYEGPITLVGDEPDPPYDRPPLSKDALAGSTDPRAPLRPDSWYAVNGITVLLADAATRLDADTVTLASGRVLRFWKLALATGAKPRMLPMLDHAGIDPHYLRTARDATRLQKSLIAGKRLGVIGAGVIGLEVAAVANAMGLTVTVIEQGEHAMARALSPFMSSRLVEHHSSAGVNFHFNARVLDAKRAPNGTSVIALDTGTEQAFDTVLAAIGAEPQSQLALDAGIKVSDGILVDEQGRTSRANIYAAGDVARFACPWHGRSVRMEQWQHAIAHGRAVARSMLGSNAFYRQVPWFWSDQHDLSLQVVGRTDGTSEAQRGDGMVSFHMEDGCLIGATTINQPRLRRPLALLVEHMARIEPEILIDPATDLKDLARRVGAQLGNS